MMKSFSIGKKSYLRVNRSHPCPICGKSDWCFLSYDQKKAYCARLLDDTKPSFADTTVYDLENHEVVEVQTSNIAQEQLAKANILHKVYSLVLSVLGLSDDHYAHLIFERGLSPEAISLRSYASFTKETAAKQVSERTRNASGVATGKTIWEEVFTSNGLPKDAWRGVPGFWYSTEHQTPIFSVFSDDREGIIIPCRNAWGQIVGLQVRVDPDKVGYSASKRGSLSNKYRTFVKNIKGKPYLTVYDYASGEPVWEGVVQGKKLAFSDEFQVEIKAGAKYLWVSTAYKEYGAAANATTHFAYPDDVLRTMIFDSEGKSRVNLMSQIDNVIITEGLLKGDIIANLAPDSKLRKLNNTVVLSMAGVSNWKEAARQASKLKKEVIYLAFDQDFEGNQQVLDRLASISHHIANNLGLNPKVMVWSDEKGLDDYLLSRTEANQHISLYEYKGR